MIQPQRGGVKRLAGEALQGIDQGRARTPRRPWSAAIDSIPDEGVVDVCHMDPDLMCAAGLEPNGEQCVGVEPLQDPVVGHCRAPSRNHGHPGALQRMAPNGGIDCSTRNQYTLDQGLVLPVDAAPLELIHKRLVGRQRLGHHQESAGILVEPVHDSGPRYQGELREAMQEGVLQGAVRISGGRMHHQSRRLVDHEKLIVLEQNIQWYSLGNTLVAGLGYRPQANLLTTLHLISTPTGRAVHQHLALVDPLLQATARELGQDLGEDLVEPASGHPGADLQATLSRDRLVGIVQVEPRQSKETGNRPQYPALLYNPAVSLRANCSMIWIRSTLICALLLSLSACAWLESQKDETKDWSVSKLYSEAARELDSGNYKNAIDYYEKLEARFPFGRYAMQAQLDVAYAYYKAEEPESAIAAADRFIKLYPQNPYVDYAYYLKGIVNYNRSVGFLDRYIPTDPSQRDPGSALDAFQDFAELVRLYPDSRYAADARQRMIFLRNNLAKNEVHVARYYMKRQAYVAAANRANYVVERYQRTSAVENALEILIDAYKNLGENQLAADAERVLTLNRQAGRLLDDQPAPGDVSLGRKIWDYVGLDTN